MIGEANPEHSPAPSPSWNDTDTQRQRRGSVPTRADAELLHRVDRILARAVELLEQYQEGRAEEQVLKEFTSITGLKNPAVSPNALSKLRESLDYAAKFDGIVGAAERSLDDREACLSTDERIVEALERLELLSDEAKAFRTRLADALRAAQQDAFPLKQGQLLALAGDLLLVCFLHRLDDRLHWLAETEIALHLAGAAEFLSETEQEAQVQAPAHRNSDPALPETGRPEEERGEETGSMSPSNSPDSNHNDGSREIDSLWKPADRMAGRAVELLKKFRSSPENSSDRRKLEELVAACNADKDTYSTGPTTMVEFLMQTENLSQQFVALVSSLRQRFNERIEKIHLLMHSADKIVSPAQLRAEEAITIRAAVSDVLAQPRSSVDGSAERLVELIDGYRKGTAYPGQGQALFNLIGQHPDSIPDEVCDRLRALTEIGRDSDQRILNLAGQVLKICDSSLNPQEWSELCSLVGPGP